MSYVAVCEFLGVPFEVTEDTANDFGFLIETAQLNGTVEGARDSVKIGEQLQLAVDFFHDFIEDLKNGVAHGWFEPTSVDNIIKAANDIIDEAKGKMQ